MDAIKKYAVWLVVIATVAFHLSVAAGWLQVDNAAVLQVDGILVFLGLGSIRGKLADVFGGVDLGGVGTWLTGKKTYIISAIGLLFNVGVDAHWWDVSNTVWKFVNELLAALGVGTFAAGMNTLKLQAAKLGVMAFPLPKLAPNAGRLKKFLSALVLTALLVPQLSQAQTWDNFWHPRPHQMGISYRTTASSYLWEFKPSLVLSASCFRPSTVSGDPITTTFLSAAGPGLTLQHTSTAADGSNYADYSANLVFLITGNTQDAPTFRPAVALMAGVFNNIAEVGAGYDLVARPDELSRFFFLISVGINLTNNP